MTIRKMSITTATISIVFSGLYMVIRWIDSSYHYRFEAMKWYIVMDYNRTFLRRYHGLVLQISLLILIMALVTVVVYHMYAGVDVLTEWAFPLISAAVLVGFSVMVAYQMPRWIVIVYVTFYLVLFIALRIFFTRVVKPLTQKKSVFPFLADIVDNLSLGDTDERALTVIGLVVYIDWLVVGVSMILYVINTKQVYIEILNEIQRM